MEGGIMADLRVSGLGGVPFGTSDNRPASPSIGQTFYNGTLGYLEIYTASGWIAATGANDFNLNITSTNTNITFNQSYSSGSYSVVSTGNDSTIDIYAYASDNSLAGYTSTKAFNATQRFNRMVIIGATPGDVLSFTYKTTYATSATTSEVTAGPFITNISPTYMSNINDTVTVTGGNFATDITAAFTATGYASTSAKSITRSSSSQIIITRPDNFPTSASPYTLTLLNPNVSAPVGSNAHIASNSITAGSSPAWTTSSALPSFQKTVAYSQSVVATDVDGSSTITYSQVSATLPAGITFNTSTGVFSGTPTVNTGSYNAVIRATDSGGNYVDRTFTLLQSMPDAPTIGTPTAAVTTANVPFTAPSYTGTSTITSYTATAYINGVSTGISNSISQSGSGSITVSGLSGVTAYTFKVTATNAGGTSLPSNESSSVTTMSPITTTNMAIWYDASAPSTVVTGGKVTSLTDLSGNSRTATNANGPTYMTADLNGLPTMQFSYSSSQDLVIANPITHGTGNFHIFAVAKPKNPTGGNVDYTAVYGGNGPNPFAYHLMTNRQQILHASVAWGPQGSKSDYSTSNYYQINVKRSGGSAIAFRQSRTDDGTGTFSNNFNGPSNRLGRQQDNSYADIYIAEFILYTSPLSDADRNAVENYLYTKWGV
jgi:hypothetical protein